ncbi:phosphatidylinositol-4-phosphate 5-kinase [Trypanosoma rangeli]|uniref:Phosphatidylinositol-4-phosphate 5-kinase n=1 Tax=Trypanosoma rangeli TaxID=5698 RepID=A0A422NRK6_TRYRA|nr:phosphatidylinositol-4-phosphate 5-kinase [Trypanosoma rangeli]RNF08076.1 phosphatidylinositol-4-phosphate 5-kinase [Trypanosoma rangeli]|eukprot:RNF08076.1 phosphatidylinositol-4-phosphate 5-kinase [Trypanosoma rangeli]
MHAFQRDALLHIVSRECEGACQAASGGFERNNNFKKKTTNNENAALAAAVQRTPEMLDSTKEVVGGVRLLRDLFLRQGILNGVEQLSLRGMLEGIYPASSHRCCAGSS